MPKVSKERQAECKTRLLELLQPGDRIFGFVTHVSRSGMSRRIDFYIFRPRSDKPEDQRNPDRRWLTPWMGDLLGWSWNDSGIKVDGCGMDMIFHTTYSVSHLLFRDHPDFTAKDAGYALREP